MEQILAPKSAEALAFEGASIILLNLAFPHYTAYSCIYICAALSAMDLTARDLEKKEKGGGKRKVTEDTEGKPGKRQYNKKAKN